MPNFREKWSLKSNLSSAKLEGGVYRALGTENHFAIQAIYDKSKPVKLTNHFVYCRAVADDLRLKFRISTGRLVALCMQKRLMENIHITVAARARMTNTEWLDFRGDPVSFGVKLAFFY